MDPNRHSEPSRRGVRVEVRDLRRSFGSTPVLKGITLTVDPGELFVVMGPSGSGKSVLLKHIIGLEIPDQGQIRIADQPVQSEGLLDAVRVAMVFQSGALLNSLTVAENVGLYLTEHRLKPAPEIRRIVTDKLNLVGLGGQEDRYPSELSGGMRKRVGLARALVTRPKVVLFDVPNTGLDPLVGQEVYDLIKETKQTWGYTGIVISHELPEVFQVADRVVMLLKGNIVKDGTPQEFIDSDNPAVQQFLYGRTDGPIRIQ